MKPVILYTCDIWKGFSSFKTVGVFTNRKKLEQQIKRLWQDEIIECDSDDLTIRSSLKNLTVENFNNTFDYLYMEEIEFNVIQ